MKTYTFEFSGFSYSSMMLEVGLWLGIFGCVCPDRPLGRALCWVSLAIAALTVLGLVVLWLARRLPITGWEERRFLRTLEEDQKRARESDPDNQ